MRIAIVSLNGRPWLEGEIPYSLAALRLGLYLLAKMAGCTIRLFAFPVDASSGSIADELSAFEPDVLALPSYIWNVDLSREVALKVAEGACDRVRIVVGGPGAESADWSAWPTGTTFVLGPGEQPLLELCQRMEGHAGRGEETTVLLGSAAGERADFPLGLPAFGPEMTGMLAGDSREWNMVWWETTRGCIYSCTFCGHRTAPRFIESDLGFVAQEIEMMRRRHVRRVFVVDPIFGGHRQRGKEILRLLQRGCPDAELVAFLRPEFLDDEYVQLLSDGNVGELMIGIQTTNPAVAKAIRDNHLAGSERHLQALSAAGINWRAELIVGLPGDDLAGLRESFRYVVDRLRPRSVHAYHLTVIPNTPLFAMMGRTAPDPWIKADRRLRVTATYSCSESEMLEMLEFAAALTSLYSFSLATGRYSPDFASLDAVIDQVREDPTGAEQLRAMVHAPHAAAAAVWQKIAGRSGHRSQDPPQGPNP